MAWISDWPASEIVGVDLAARRVARTLHVGDQPNQPVSMTAGAGSLSVLDFSGPLRRMDPGHRSRHQALPGPRAGRRRRLRDGFIWMITDELAADGGHEFLWKIDRPAT